MANCPNILNIYYSQKELKHFGLETKYNTTKIFFKIEYIFICMQSSEKLFNHFTCNKPIGKKI